MKRADFTHYLSTLLPENGIKDYCPNGLQVSGKNEIKTLITGVTACQALIDAAIAAQADAILVHHGFFWKGEDPCLIGPKKNRIKALIEHDINLYAYHLPLDLHPTLGNNAGLAQAMNWTQTHTLTAGGTDNLLSLGTTPDCSASELAQALAHRLDRKPLHLDGGPKIIKKLAWCTGAAQDFIEDAALAGAEAFITGEASERTTHMAKELGIHAFIAGHHATERFGVQAVGEQIEKELGLKHQNIDIANPV